MQQHLPLSAHWGGMTVHREKVLGWEFGRAQRAYRFLVGKAAPRGADVDVLRDSVFETKREIGPEGCQERVASRVALSDVVMNLAGLVSMGHRVSSSIRVQSPTGSAADFVEWFNAQSAEPDSDAMLKANPDHWFIGDDGGRQKVVETTGGSPLPTRFYIDYDDISSLTTPASPDFPLQIAGVARTRAGRPVGGVRHQFRDLDGGFESWLTVEFPFGVPVSMLRGHQWHLACEFGNWIEFQQQA